MKSDLEIAQEATLQPVREIAALLGLERDEIELYGDYKAKIKLSVLDTRAGRPRGKLVLCTALTPTRAGEGKTTVNIGLSMGLARLGKKAVTTLREPSLGPSFGIKGGAAGVVTPRWCPWRRSICTSRAICTPSRLLITCAPPLSTTICSRATNWR